MTAAPRGSLTVLQVARGFGVSKTIDARGTTVKGFAAGKYFVFRAIGFHGWEGDGDTPGARRLLDELHSARRHFPVLGQAVPEALDGTPHRRLKHRDPHSSAANHGETDFPVFNDWIHTSCLHDI